VHWALALTLPVSFALLFTLHWALVWQLAKRPPWWLSLLALLFVPTAPVWGYRAGFKKLATAWTVCALVYLVALVWSTQIGGEVGHPTVEEISAESP
jgi:hypothetical protein